MERRICSKCEKDICEKENMFNIWKGYVKRRICSICEKENLFDMWKGYVKRKICSMYTRFSFLLMIVKHVSCRVCLNPLPFPTYRRFMTHLQQRTFKLMLQKKKLLIISNFTFCHNIPNFTQWLYFHLKRITEF